MADTVIQKSDRSFDSLTEQEYKDFCATLAAEYAEFAAFMKAHPEATNIVGEGTTDLNEFRQIQLDLVMQALSMIKGAKVTIVCNRVMVQLPPPAFTIKNANSMFTRLEEGKLATSGVLLTIPRAFKTDSNWQSNSYGTGLIGTSWVSQCALSPIFIHKDITSLTYGAFSTFTGFNNISQDDGLPSFSVQFIPKNLDIPSINIANWLRLAYVGSYEDAVGWADVSVGITILYNGSYYYRSAGSFNADVDVPGVDPRWCKIGDITKATAYSDTVVYPAGSFVNDGGDLYLKLTAAPVGVYPEDTTYSIDCPEPLVFSIVPDEAYSTATTGFAYSPCEVGMNAGEQAMLVDSDEWHSIVGRKFNAITEPGAYRVVAWATDGRKYGITGEYNIYIDFGDSLTWEVIDSVTPPTFGDNSWITNYTHEWTPEVASTWYAKNIILTSRLSLDNTVDQRVTSTAYWLGTVRTEEARYFNTGNVINLNVSTPVGVNESILIDWKYTLELVDEINSFVKAYTIEVAKRIDLQVAKVYYSDIKSEYTMHGTTEMGLTGTLPGQRRGVIAELIPPPGDNISCRLSTQYRWGFGWYNDDTFNANGPIDTPVWVPVGTSSAYWYNDHWFYGLYYVSGMQTYTIGRVLYGHY